ncbi:MAG: hypothetical protein ACLUP5_01795 [Streptococcus sp.]
MPNTWTDVDTNSKVYSSAYIKPLSEGSGVQVEIVTPTKITKSFLNNISKCSHYIWRI